MAVRTNWADVLKMNAFQERLKLLRQARNITQVRLAELIGADPRVYNRWERGLATPQFDAVVKIADVLQVTLDELVGRTGPSSEVRLHNHDLDRLYREVDNLPDEDQHALLLVIDSFIKKAQMSKLIQSTGS